MLHQYLYILMCHLRDCLRLFALIASKYLIKYSEQCYSLMTVQLCILYGILCILCKYNNVTNRNLVKFFFFILFSFLFFVCYHCMVNKVFHLTIINLRSRTILNKTRSVAARFGRRGMPPPSANDTGTRINCFPN